MAKICLDFYKGVDEYSDGDIEDKIFDIVKNDSDFNDVLTKENRWPVLYHLSPERRNLLEWFDFKKKSSLLEIGAGCGALTGLFCEKAGSVTAVELSKRRAEIIYERYKNISNLEIVVGNFKDIKFGKKFDYVTLIGVLEYAKNFIDGKDPYVGFLSSIRSVLKKGGTLFIAIENKFGLKYWAGAREDHTGRFFDGMENYVYSGGKIRTFSKDELIKMMEFCGFKKWQFRYPHPDYKFCDEVFSDDFLPKENDVLRSASNYDAERVILFNERIAMLNLIKDKRFDLFANSYLIIVSN